MWRVLAGAKVRSDLSYRTSFVLNLLGNLGATFLDFLQILVIFGRVPHLAGWSVNEVAFLYGVSSLGAGLADATVGSAEHLDRFVMTGRLDTLLLRPVSPLLQLTADDFALRRFGRAIQAAAVLAFAMVRLDPTVGWGPLSLAVVAGTVVSATLLFAGIWVIGSAALFWLLNGREFLNAFTYGGNYATQYPLDIFGTWLRRLLTLVVPTAFVIYFPATWLFHKPDAFGAPAWTPLLTPFVALALLAVARLAWAGGLRHYRSTGS